MAGDSEIFAILQKHGVPFVIVGGHAVALHGFVRATEDCDVVWVRSGESEQKLLAALGELEARYIGKEIDPATGMERTYPVSLEYIRAYPLMMLTTRLGFLDLFDYIPGAPHEEAKNLLATSVESGGLRYASLDWLRKMKQAAARPRDKLDLENLPEAD